MRAEQIIYTCNLQGGDTVFSRSLSFPLLDADFALSTLLKFEAPDFEIEIKNKGIQNSGKFPKRYCSIQAKEKKTFYLIALNTHIGNEIFPQVRDHFFGHGLVIEKSKMTVNPGLLLGSTAFLVSKDINLQVLKTGVDTAPSEWKSSLDFTDKRLMEHHFIQKFLSEQKDKFVRMLACLLYSMCDKTTAPKQILINDSSDNIQLWTASLLLTFPSKIAQEIIYSTYEFYPHNTDFKIIGVFDQNTKYILNNPDTPNKHFYFDFKANFSSENPFPEKYIDNLCEFIYDCLTGDYAELEKFHTFYEDICRDESFNPESYNATYILYILSTSKNKESIRSVFDDYGIEALICAFAMIDRINDKKQSIIDVTIEYIGEKNVDIDNNLLTCLKEFIYKNPDKKIINKKFLELCVEKFEKITDEDEFYKIYDWFKNKLVHNIGEAFLGELQDTSYKLQDTSYKLQDTSYKLQVDSSQVQNDTAWKTYFLVKLLLKNSKDLNSVSSTPRYKKILNDLVTIINESKYPDEEIEKHYTIAKDNTVLHIFYYIMIKLIIPDESKSLWRGKYFEALPSDAYLLKDVIDFIYSKGLNDDIKALINWLFDNVRAECVDTILKRSDFNDRYFENDTLANFILETVIKYNLHKDNDKRNLIEKLQNIIGKDKLDDIYITIRLLDENNAENINGWRDLYFEKLTDNKKIDIKNKLVMLYNGNNRNLSLEHQNLIREDIPYFIKKCGDKKKRESFIEELLKFTNADIHGEGFTLLIHETIINLIKDDTDELMSIIKNLFKNNDLKAITPFYIGMKKHITDKNILEDLTNTFYNKLQESKDTDQISIIKNLSKSPDEIERLKEFISEVDMPCATYIDLLKEIVSVDSLCDKMEEWIEKCWKEANTLTLKYKVFKFIYDNDIFKDLLDEKLKEINKSIEPLNIKLDEREIIGELYCKSKNKKTGKIELAYICIKVDELSKISKKYDGEKLKKENKSLFKDFRPLERFPENQEIEIFEQIKNYFAQSFANIAYSADFHDFPELFSKDDQNEEFSKMIFNKLEKQCLNKGKIDILAHYLIHDIFKQRTNDLLDGREDLIKDIKKRYNKKNCDFNMYYSQQNREQNPNKNSIMYKIIQNPNLSSSAKRKKKIKIEKKNKGFLKLLGRSIDSFIEFIKEYWILLSIILFLIVLITLGSCIIFWDRPISKEKIRYMKTIKNKPEMPTRGHNQFRRSTYDYLERNTESDEQSENDQKPYEY